MAKSTLGMTFGLFLPHAVRCGRERWQKQAESCSFCPKTVLAATELQREQHWLGSKDVA